MVEGVWCSRMSCRGPNRKGGVEPDLLDAHPEPESVELIQPAQNRNLSKAGLATEVRASSSFRPYIHLTGLPISAWSLFQRYSLQTLAEISTLCFYQRACARTVYAKRRLEIQPVQHQQHSDHMVTGQNICQFAYEPLSR